jgi:hypothetical protein
MNIGHPFAAAVLAASLVLAWPAAAVSQTTGAIASAPSSRAAAQRTFGSPQEAVNALLDALKAGDRTAVLDVVGPSAKSWLFSGDPVADTKEWRQFVSAYEAKHALTSDAAGNRTLLTVGPSDFQFAAPIVKRGDRWVFDTAAGREETLNRRVGRNELDTIQTLLAVVDAQREYAIADADSNRLHDYARHFISSSGKKDGLYWPTSPGEPQSPLGPLVAAAMKEGYQGKERALKPTPYNGYFYRMLTSQGRSATGGQYSYLVKGKMFGGFGVVAYPAKYGVSGVMTFVVNHDGVVFEKDLGPSTEALSAKLSSFNPDSSWKKVD